MDARVEVEELDIVIAGGGICGLATALAFHRKGIRSVVLEKSETLRSAGAAVGIHNNGWLALDHLGIGSKLRSNAIPLRNHAQVIFLDRKKQWPESPFSVGEVRCIKRSDLMEVLARELPAGTMRYGYHLVSVKLDPLTSNPTLEFLNGRIIKAKVLIGCDGAHSIVANFLKINPKKVFPKIGVRGLTYCPNGHGLPPALVRTHKVEMAFGTVPINENRVFWYLILPGHPPATNDGERIRQVCLEQAQEFPEEILKIIEDCDTSDLSVTYFWYRSAWDMLVGKFREGRVTLAGDAMHVMGPFLGQGTNLALEDAVVLGRCLSQKLNEQPDLLRGTKKVMQKEIGEALDAYVKQRRMKLVGISAQTYLTGLLMGTAPHVVKIFIAMLLHFVFRDPVRHTRFDCGPL